MDEGDRTRTFLIADVRGYTAYTMAHGDASAARLTARFADVVAAAAAPRQGELLELRGDEALVVFSSARQAVRAAVDLQSQLGLASELDPSVELKVGVGIDSGEAVAVKGGFRGAALNLAARLCGAAGAGEVLVSETVFHLAGHVDGLRYVDRGRAVFKGLPEPIAVYQIGREAEIPAQLPPLQPSSPSFHNSLPDELTPFVGRERELEAVSKLLREPSVRLVTLTGPAGCGKTRLAEKAARLLTEHVDGVAFVALAGVGDAALVAPTIAGALGVRETGDRPLMQSLLESLHNRQVLLILDNFEHLHDSTPLISELLDASRTLKMLVTSRAVLRLAREREYPVPLLAVPPRDADLDLEALRQCESVALFVERARAVRPDFLLTPENARDIAAICVQLEGLPLAIELAAARIRIFPVHALQSRLSNRLQLLTGGARDAPERQQTLRGAIDWSYELLAERERIVLARLSVFAGGCTLEAAEAIGGDALDVLEGLSSLVENSLVQQEGTDEPRFRMLEVIREYGRERLQHLGEGDAIHDRHAAHFTSVAQEARRELASPRQHAALARLDAEHDNLRAALSWLLGAGEGERAMELAVALWRFWWVRGHLSEGRHWLDSTLSVPAPLPAALRAAALNAAGSLAWWQGDLARAEALLQECLEVRRALGDRGGEGAALSNLGLVAEYQGDFARAAGLHADALEAVRDSGERERVAQMMGNLATAVMNLGELERARSLSEESLVLWRQLGNRLGELVILHTLGVICLKGGDAPAAVRHLTESLAMARELDHRETSAACLEALGWVAASVDDSERALTLFGAAAAARRATGRLLPRAEAALHDRYAALVAGEGGVEVESAAYKVGGGMRLSAAIAFALREPANTQGL